MDELKEIIDKCLQNDRIAQNKLYKMLGGKLLGVCMRYTRSRFEAEDYLQESFIRIFTNLSKYSFEGSFEGWARRITVNVILKDFEKKNLFRNSVELDNYTETAASTEDITSSIRHNELLGFINNLPEGQKMVFNLFAIEGFSHKEIAEMLNITEGTSKSQLSKAKDNLIGLHQKHNREYEQKLS